MDIAVVLPVYNERENLRPLLAEIEQALQPTSRSFEVIAIDDGSTDGSGEVLHDLAAQKPYLKAIFFRQNYGQSAAFDAGFRAASADHLLFPFTRTASLKREYCRQHNDDEQCSATNSNWRTQVHSGVKQAQLCE